MLSLVLSILIGVPLGLISGFVGGWFDRMLVFVMDAIYSLPVAAAGDRLLVPAARRASAAASSPPRWRITAVYIPQYFRVVRNTTVSARESTYVEAARALGAKPFTIMRKYLFGNVVQSVPVIGTLNAADALGTLAALGFLGFGIQPTEASEWGYDLSRALDDAQAGIWWPALFPGLALILLITALTLVGEGLNETLNPSLRRRRFQTGRRSPRRETQPEEAAPMTPDRAGDEPAGDAGRPGSGARGSRPAGLVRHRAGAGEGGRRRLLRAAARRDPRPGRRVRVRQVDARPRAARPAARRRRPRRASCGSRAGTCSP